MKFSKLPILSNFSIYFDIGTWLLLTAGLLCLIILLWIGIIIIGNILLIGNVFNPHQSTMQVKLFYSLASVFLGLFLAIFMINIAELSDKRLSKSATKITDKWKSHLS
ncbi:MULTISPECIES: hypothetical protein [unclassified Tolypothrix]|uniref:hypothetical protein n=1 Tax=unclassified Tolypothrix TaxID=2649714 RepID=UPI0005EAAF8C|nr:MULTISPECIES: hypothetical protein [unclassified Tolypothrix]BAY91268.1 hypothetical protein NIES3275_32910 [Microchaete diplosiphon NIES-3275]EKF04206.1 hypothetical protein FDUTEX481_01884 [Tolypothrix sp. PCC 7601]MBE9080908.1 hypothetical protein [Tolypothrix sp. LEGE 11397]UYD25342.1 hypothetical protein HGR01_28815 [Tolypothrix sp. PCC 7712]UYD32414.1 hypothetical protein HG267_25750 [Tolypothrix sp. PCC 7601]